MQATTEWTKPDDIVIEETARYLIMRHHAVPFEVVSPFWLRRMLRLDMKLGRPIWVARIIEPEKAKAIEA